MRAYMSIWHRNQKTIIVLVLSIILFFVVRTLLFEQREVSSFSDSEQYRYQGNDPLDLALFKRLVDTTFGESQIISSSEFFNQIMESDREDTTQEDLYIFVEPGYLNQEWVEALTSISVLKNDILFVTTTSVPIDDNLYIYPSYSDIDTMVFNINEFLYPYTKGEMDDFIQNVPKDLSIPKSIHEQIEKVATTSYVYKSFIEDTDQVKDSIVVDTFYVKLTFGEASVAIDAFPFMLTNLASSEAFYYPHFKYLLEDYEPSKVYLVKANLHRGEADTNPMSYLLSFTGPKLAVYLLLLTCLFYLYNGRRREKAIPLVTPVENTTMDFVDSVSRLYLQSDQEGQLSAKMISNFYKFVESKYNIVPSANSYWQRVQRISMVSENLVDQIQSSCQIIAQFGVNNEVDYQRLHMILSKFYNQAK